MLLASALRRLHGRHMKRRPSLAKPGLGRKSYPLIIELLEERLPPGDAVFTGLLASDLGQPAAHVTGASLVVPPGLAQRLAGAATDAFALPTGLADASLSLVSAFAPARRDTPRTTQDEPAPSAAAGSRVSTAGIPEAGSLPVGTASAMAAPPGSASVSLNVAAALPPPNYQLDQAAAAVVAPRPESDDLSPADLDTGAGVQASGVRPLFDLGHPTTGPFPSNVFTVPDRTQNTDRRVNLPYPDCQVYVSDCEDIAVLNELDGFNLQPRLSVPFSGPIDVNTVTSETVFLVSLGSTVPGQGWMPRGTVVGINQVVWDVETNSLHVESDQLLAQHTRFALIVTNGIRDADGDPVEASREFRRFRQTVPQPYKRELLDALQEARRLGVRERDIVVASVFTTQSATAVLEKIRDQIKAHTPEPADFLLGPNGERTVFNFDDVTGISWIQQTRDNPPGFSTPVNINLSLMGIIPDVIGRVAFGKYTSPVYRTAERLIPPVGTRTGNPVAQGTNELYFTLVLPSGPQPAGGWPVAIYGHGGGNNRHNGMRDLSASLASQGLASLHVDVVGHGFGPLGTLTVTTPAGGPVTFPSGGRSLDADGDGAIGASEGQNPGAPYTLLASRPAVWQMVADLLQLVRVVETGLDADGDGTADLDPARIYFVGQSFGGQFGAPFLAVEPSVRAGALTVTPGSSEINFRLGAVVRSGQGAELARRVPSLINSPGVVALDGAAVGAPYYDDNLPLRDGHPLTVTLEDSTVREIRSPVVNTVAGAVAIQAQLERIEWARMDGFASAYAPHLRKAPLAGVPAKSVIVLFAKGDQQVPNPSMSHFLRAGDLADRATFYRHDLAFAERPQLPRNPHVFMTSIGTAAFQDIALGAQAQVAAFFASGGKEVIHPEPQRFFEVPIQGPLPEDLCYIQ